MTFPTIIYKYNGIYSGEQLATLTDQKLVTLEKFINDGVMATCEVEFEKVTAQQHGQIYRVEANLTLDGTLYRAEAVEESFEKAIDEVRNELDKELRRAKDKQTSLLKRTGRKIKEQLLGWRK
ncbi:MAG: ribosome-associated translation inhibitor RaiA [Patescibacteria group bacterium]